MGSAYETKGQLFERCYKNQIQNRYAYNFVPNIHCSLPCTGKYIVDVQSFNKMEPAIAEVFVGMNNEKEIIIQLCNHSKLSYNDRELCIKWLERLDSEGIMKEQQLKELVPNS